MGRQSTYPEERRHEAVRLVLTTDRTRAEASRDLGVSYEAFGN